MSSIVERTYVERQITSPRFQSRKKECRLYQVNEKFPWAFSRIIPKVSWNNPKPFPSRRIRNLKIAVTFGHTSIRVFFQNKVQKIKNTYSLIILLIRCQWLVNSFNLTLSYPNRITASPTQHTISIIHWKYVPIEGR